MTSILVALVALSGVAFLGQLYCLVTRKENE